MSGLARQRSWLRRISAPAVLVALCLIATAAVSETAYAFRLPVNFNQAAAIGGSGGRYFTGSPSDRYTCKVCHTGAATPVVQVSGLPFGGYVPGTTYQILVDWDDALPSVAFNFEVTDSSGRAFGTFGVPPREQLTPADLCSGTSAVVVASHERTLALVTECGAHQATLLWTAPPPTPDATGRLITPDAWFSGSLVVSNKDGSIAGDGVKDLSHVFGVLGQAAPAATEINGGCNVTRPGPRSTCGACVMLSVLGVMCWRNRGRKAVS